MNTIIQQSTDYQRIEQAIRYLQDNARRQPDLAEVAAHIGLSEYHFQRLFTRWAGISPKRFLQFLTKENAKSAAFADLGPFRRLPDRALRSGSLARPAR